jgi:TonB family protein
MQHLLLRSLFIAVLFPSFTAAAPPDSGGFEIEIPAAPAESLPPLEKVPELKQFIQAEYPAEALKKGIEGSVSMELIISDSGRVDSVKVLRGLDPALDSAAVKAARQFSFTPAMAQGMPVPVALEYEYKFFITDEVSKLEVFINLAGILREKGTRQPIKDGMVVLAFPDTAADTSLTIPWNKYIAKIGAFPGQYREEGRLVTMTDSLGRFAFQSLPSGRVKMMFPITGYKMDSVVEMVEREKRLEVEYRLERETYNEYEIVVYGRIEKQEVAKKSLSITEVKRIPGFGGDAVKVIQALPGVARASFISGEIIVRGSGNTDTRYFLDGVEIPLLFHFGGLKSTYNSDALASIDLYPGGFNTRYGGCVGGVVEIKGRPAKTDRWHGNAGVNLFDASFLVEGPLTKELSVLATARRSYLANMIKWGLDAFDIVIPMTVVPFYWDLVSRLDYKASNRNRMFLTAFAGADKMEFITQLVRGGSTEVSDAKDEISLNLAFKKLLYGWDYSFGNRLDNELRFSLGRNDKNFNILSFAKVDFKDYSLYLRDQVVYKAEPWITVRPGLDISLDTAEYSISTFSGDGAVNTSNKGTYAGIGGYVNAEISPLDSLYITPGIRYDYYTELNQGVPSFRLTGRYSYRKGHTIKGAWGAYNQMPQPLGQSTDPFWGNPDLPPTLARQAVLGYEYDITDLINLDAQVYYNTQGQIPRFTDSITSAGKRLNLLSDAKGRMYGLEIMLRHDPSEHFFGWIAYTLSRSERQSPVPATNNFGNNFNGVWDPLRWFLFDSDQTHNLQVVASWKLPFNFEAGARLRFVTGNPYTPRLGFTENKFEYNAEYGYYQTRSGEPRSDRMGPFFQVDARVDKKFVYNDWIFSAYLDVQNVNYFWYNSPESYSYNYDGSGRQVVGSIILPALGIRAEF